jgi:hypothetical protein
MKILLEYGKSSQMYVIGSDNVIAMEKMDEREVPNLL